MFMDAADVSAMERDPAVHRMAAMIYDYCGIDYSDNLYSLVSKLSSRLSSMGMSFYQYMEHLKKTPEEWDALVECVTINETYFFREESQLQELVQTVLPQLAGRGAIRIWSAACSTGEEPYSLAMAIAESRVASLSQVQIYATDINKKVLQFAERGVYGKHSMCFRRTPEEMRAKYFDEDEQGFRVKDFIRERVRFGHANLLMKESCDLPTLDVIFCRNVLIYFDPPTVKRVVQHLSDRLATGGHLFLGHAETVSGLLPELRTVNAASTFYYRKDGEGK